MEFRIHSTHNHIAEHVEFWITCEEFRCSGDANMQVFAQKIYGDFVIFNGPKEV
jgi:hypothetical protein